MSYVILVLTNIGNRSRKSFFSKINILTKNDLKAIKQIVQETATTKKDLDELVTKNIFDQFKDRVFTLLDKVMGELKTIREEQTVIAGRQSENTDTLEDHEVRIGKLEKILQP